jgi:hypothetical protein
MQGPERRQSPRTTLETFAYINLGANNYGSVLNISETGLCFRSALPVIPNRKLHFWFSEHNHRIEAVGEVAWADETKKMGGLHFTSLSTEAQQQIRHWITNPTVPLPLPEPSGPVMLPEPVPVHPDNTVANRITAQTFPSATIRVPFQLSGFSAGLGLGLLVAALVTGIFLFQNYRRDIGESLIRLGERFAAKSQSAQAQTPANPTTVLADSQFISAAPQPGQTPSTSATTQDANATLSRAAFSVPNSDASKASKREDPKPNDVKAQSGPVNPKPDNSKSNSPVSETKQNVAKPDPKQVAVTPAAPTLSNQSSSNTSDPPAAPPTPKANSLPAHTRGPVGNLVAGNVQPPLPVASTHASAPIVVAREESKETKPGPPPQMFFEVGKFKDSSGARKAKDDLNQLGFHSSVMQKNRLWMNSYLVLVGPYSDDQTALAANKKLVAQDFDPRPFERGTRNLEFKSGLTLNGARMPDGNCTVSWESYATDTQVKIEQDHQLVTRTTGRWTPTQAKYRRDAFVFRKNPDGTHTLLEIQFSGLDKTLVFSNPS